MGFLDSLFGEEKKVEKEVKTAPKEVEKKAESVPEQVKSIGATLLGTVKRTPGRFCYVTKDGKVYETAPKRKAKK